MHINMRPQYGEARLAVGANARALVAFNLHKPAEDKQRTPYSRSISAVCPDDYKQPEVVCHVV